MEKIRGAVNPADLMTKHLDGTTMRTMCGLLDLKFETGRAAAAPKLEKDSGYVTRCAKLLAAVSLLSAVRGEPNEQRDRYGRAGATGASDGMGDDREKTGTDSH